jgi:hypothetical protein
VLVVRLHTDERTGAIEENRYFIGSEGSSSYVRLHCSNLPVADVDAVLDVASLLSNPQLILSSKTAVYPEAGGAQYLEMPVKSVD